MLPNISMVSSWDCEKYQNQPSRAAAVEPGISLEICNFIFRSKKNSVRIASASDTFVIRSLTLQMRKRSLETLELRPCPTICRHRVGRGFTCAIRGEIDWKLLRDRTLLL